MAKRVERVGHGWRRAAFPLLGTGGFLNFPEAFGFRGFFIMTIQRETTRYQPVPRGGGAIAERSTDGPDVQFSVSEDVKRKLRVGKDHPAQTDKVDLPCANECLSDVRQKFLKVRIPRTHHNQVGMPRLDPPDGVDLTRDAHKRVFRWLVTI